MGGFGTMGSSADPYDFELGDDIKLGSSSKGGKKGSKKDKKKKKEKEKDSFGDSFMDEDKPSAKSKPAAAPKKQGRVTLLTTVPFCHPGKEKEAFGKKPPDSFLLRGQPASCDGRNRP